MTYTHIVHIADIHIRTDRTEEYEAVFNKLFKVIKDKTTTPLIVLCGDIIHLRSNITPEVIKKVLYLFSNLAKLGKCILINGNHDFSETHTSRDKFLEVIPKDDNMSYLTTSDTYFYDNVQVGVSSLDDKGFTKYEKHPSDISIALGHYTLDEVSFHMKGSYNVNDHAGYDFALLGDIHARGKYGPNCYYSGSLIQQSYGESLDKGIGIVDISTKSYDFVDIPNEYAFITVNTNADGDLMLPKTFPPHSNIRIRRSTLHESRDIEYEIELKKHTNVTSMKKVITISTVEDNLLESHDNLLEPHDDMAIMLDLVKDHPSREELIKLHEQYRIDSDTAPQVQQNFYIKKLEFENMMNYTSKCIINFDEIQGIIGIHGQNATGKSNILRIIVFALCGNISVDYASVDSRGRKGKVSATQSSVKYSYEISFILNKSANKGYTEIIFKYGDIDYKVRRDITKRTSDGLSSSKVTLHRWDDTSQLWMTHTSLKKETDLEIHNMVGRSPLFMLMNVYNRNSTSMITCNPRERYSIIASLFDTEMFETIGNVVHTELKELREMKAFISGKLDHIIMNDIDIKEKIDREALDEESMKLNKWINKLKSCYTADITPENADTIILNMQVDELLVTAKRDRQSIKKYEALVVNIPSGDQLKASRDDHNLIVQKYLSLKHCEAVTEDLPQISNLPEPCKTNIKAEDVTPLDTEISLYNYSATLPSRDILIGMLAKFSYPHTHIAATVTARPIPSFDVFNTSSPPNPDTDISKKEEITKFIKDYDHPNLESLQQDIDDINIPNIELIHSENELHLLMARYPKGSTFIRHPEVGKCHTPNPSVIMDIDLFQKQICVSIIESKELQPTHSKVELIKLTKRYTSGEIFIRHNQVIKPKTLPKKVIDPNQLQKDIDAFTLGNLITEPTTTHMTHSKTDLKSLLSRYPNGSTFIKHPQVTKQLGTAISPIDVEVIQNTIDLFEVPLKLVNNNKQTKEEIIKQLSRYPSGTTFTKHPEVAQCHATNPPMIDDLNQLQKEIDTFILLEMLPLSKTKPTHTKKELLKLTKRYPKEESFERHSYITKPTQLPTKVTDPLEIQNKINDINVHPLRKILTKRIIRTNPDELRQKADTLVNIDHIVEALKSDGATQANIRLVSNIKQALPTLSDIYREINIIEKDIDHNKSVDEDSLFNTEQTTQSTKLKKLQQQLNAELYMRNKHMDYLDELEAREIMEHNEETHRRMEELNILKRQLNDELYMRNKHMDHVESLHVFNHNEESDRRMEELDTLKRQLNDELYMRNKHMDYLDELEALRVMEHNEKIDARKRQLNDELYMRNKHMDYLDELEALNLTQRKASLQDALKKATNRAATMQHYLITQKDIEYTEYFNANVAIHLPEICRMISYLDTKQQRDNLYDKYLQNVSYLTKGKHDYDELQIQLKYIRYFNDYYTTKITKKYQSLTNINATIADLTEKYSTRLKEIDELLLRSKHIDEAKNIANEASKIDDELKIKTIYQQLLLKNDGIKAWILNKYLTILEDNINKNLDNYRIGLKLESNALNLSIHKGAYVLQPCQLSGYEAFALEMSTKRVLNHFSTVGTSQILLLDEGFDVIDSNNLEVFNSLLQKMKTYYKHIMLISHSSTIKDMVEHVITPNSIRQKKTLKLYREN